MAFDGITTACLRKEFSDRLTGARIYKIAQTDRDELVLTLKPAAERGGGQCRLYLSADASLPLCYFTAKSRQAPLQSSVITLIGFKLAGQRADRNHPFGHGRVEYITGLLISISIILVGADLAKSSLNRILYPVQTVHSGAAAAILLVSIAVKFYMFFYNRSLAEQIDSVALRSTAMDSISDCAATFAVLLCQLLSAKFGLHLDGWCGLAVSLFILHAGIRSAFDTVTPLLGTAPDPTLSARIEEMVLPLFGMSGS